MQIPHYRGSNKYTRFVVPFPTIKYRSKYFNVDRGKVQGLLYRSKIFEFDVSISGSLPASSDKNSVRVGMPTLDTTFEVGPSLIAHLWSSKDANSKIWFEFPVRAATSVSMENLAIKNHGFISSPSISFKKNSDSWNLKLSLGPIYANSHYHNYFYGVKEEYKTLTRASYNANSGYSGSKLFFKVDKKIQEKWIFHFFVRYDTISNATFRDSPLIERDDNFSLGLVIMRQIAKSKRLYMKNTNFD